MHIMNDLETLDLRPSAVLLSIGMVSFVVGEKSGLYDKFYRPIFVEGQEELGRTISAETQKWWSQQSEEARQVFTDPNRVPLKQALQELSLWMDLQRATPDDPLLVWGNGADFDNVLLSHAFHSCGLTLPWKFYNSRCFRTLKNLKIPAPLELITTRVGTHHNSLNDSEYQANLAIYFLEKIETLK